MSFNLSTRINNLYVLLQSIIAGTVSNPMVANLNMNNFSITNANTITATVGINTPLINGQAFSLPVSNRASSTALIAINVGYTTVLTTTLTTSTVKDIDIWATVNFSYLGAGNGMNLRVLFNGTPIGQVQVITLENASPTAAENLQMVILASQLSAPSGTNTVTLQMQKTINIGSAVHSNSVCVLIGEVL